MFAPLTSFVGERGHTKVTKAKKTENWTWHGDEVYQIAFDNVKDIAFCIFTYSMLSPFEVVIM
jgi:hypothetical protein